MMITAIAALPRGVAKAVPARHLADESELAAVHADTEVAAAAAAAYTGDMAPEADMADADPSAAGSAAAPTTRHGKKKSNKAKKEKPIPPELAIYDFEHYDSEDDVDGAGAFAEAEAHSGLAHYATNDEDPYLLIKDDDDLDDIDNFIIQPNDTLIITSVTEEDYTHLDVWIYEQEDDNMYVHHDLILAEPALSLAWLDYDPHVPGGGRGNLLAVSSFTPGIDIYNLDVVDNLEPHCTLGGYDAQAMAAAQKAMRHRRNRRKEPQVRLAEGSHTDAVLSLSWHRQYRNLLASASADTTIKIWDLNVQACSQTLAHHTEKIQSLAWHPVDPAVLLSGGFGAQVSCLDVRSPTAVRTWALGGDVECVAWNPFFPQYFLASTDAGTVTCHDALQDAAAAPLFTLQAHTKEATAMQFSPHVPNVVVTASADKTMKVWDVTGHVPTLCGTRERGNGGVGKFFCLTFVPDAPLLIFAGGQVDESSEQAKPVTWNLNELPALQHRLAQHQQQQ